MTRAVALSAGGAEGAFTLRFLDYHSVPPNIITATSARDLELTPQMKAPRRTALNRQIHQPQLRAARLGR